MTARQAKKILRANSKRHSRRSRLAAGRRMCRRYRQKDFRSGWLGWRMGRWDPCLPETDPWLKTLVDMETLRAFAASTESLVEGLWAERLP